MRPIDRILLWTLCLLWGGSFLFNELVLEGPPAASSVWGRVALAALSMALAYLIFFRIPGSAGAPAILLMTFLIPFSAAGPGWLVLGERLEPRHLVGLGMILGGLGLIERAQGAGAGR